MDLFIEMSFGNCQKWHFQLQDPKFQNFLESLARLQINHQVWSTFGSRYILCVRTPSKCQATPLEGAETSITELGIREHTKQKIYLSTHKHVQFLYIYWDSVSLFLHLVIFVNNIMEILVIPDLGKELHEFNKKVKQVKIHTIHIHNTACTTKACLSLE